jgi:magnesium-protoporphyrin O-methyltransferase
MTCRQCQGLENLFDAKTATNELKDYRKKGPSKTTKMLVAALTSKGVEGLTLLDIGGGVGAIQHELVKAGVNRVVNVDASTAYLDAAKSEAIRQGYANQASYHHGDFVELAPTIAPVDIVTLDRAICCYPDMPALVGLSSARAAKFYGLVYPRDAWWTRVGVGIINFFSWLFYKDYRFFAHATHAVEAILHQNGLKQCFYRQTFLWQIAVYGR